MQTSAPRIRPVDPAAQPDCFNPKPTAIIDAGFDDGGQLVPTVEPEIFFDEQNPVESNVRRQEIISGVIRLLADGARGPEAAGRRLFLLEHLLSHERPNIRQLAQRLGIRKSQAALLLRQLAAELYNLQRD